MPSYMEKHEEIIERRRLKYTDLGRKINIYPSRYMDSKWGVDILKREPEKKKYLITGTGRCGTTYLSALLREIGIDVPHSKVGYDGTTSHYFMADHYWYPVITYQTDDVAHIRERASDFSFEKVIHIIREPMATIRSLSIFMANIELEYWEDAGIVPAGEFSKHNDLIWRGAVIYFYLNSYIRAKYPDAYLIKLENIKQDWNNLLSYMGFYQQVAMPATPAQNKMGDIAFSETEIRVREFYRETPMLKGYACHPNDVTYSELKKIDKRHANLIAELSSSMGY